MGDDKVLYVSFDIETTGASLKTDVCFAVGYCAGYSETEIVEQGKWVLDLRAVCCDLPSDGMVCLPADPEHARRSRWQMGWEINKFEKRCFDEFWSNHLDTLERMSDEAMCLSEQTIFYNVNKLLSRLEAGRVGRPSKDGDADATEQNGEFVLLFDTVAYDTTWLNDRLQKYGYAGLTSKRDGTGYRTAYELDSFRLGMARIQPGTAPARNVADLMRSEHCIKGRDHDPEVDAHNIFVDFMEAMHGCGKPV